MGALNKISVTRVVDQWQDKRELLFANTSVYAGGTKDVPV